MTERENRTRVPCTKSVREDNCRYKLREVETSLDCNLNRLLYEVTPETRS